MKKKLFKKEKYSKKLATGGLVDIEGVGALSLDLKQFVLKHFSQFFLTLKIKF